MIVRNRPEANFTIIRNYVLERPDLSFKAKGLWAFLMTKPDGWQTTVMGIVSQCKESKQSIMNTLKELESAGLYRKVASRDSLGHFKYDDFVYDEPYTGNQHAGNQHTGNPTQVKTDIAKTEEVKTELNSEEQKPKSMETYKLQSDNVRRLNSMKRRYGFK